VATTWTNPTLCGERVLLRPLGLRDTDDLWIDVQDPELLRLTGTHHEFTYEEIVAYCASRADTTDRITLTITNPGDENWLGEIVLKDHDEPNHSASLRIALGASARNRGLGTEALRLVLAHAFGPLGLHRVALEVFDFNTRAIHVYEKVGFRHEGRMRDALWWDGAPHDTLLMAALATEYESVTSPPH
jgi:RimJ/RimL family protein N-acetyltransferase